LQQGKASLLSASEPSQKHGSRPKLENKLFLKLVTKWQAVTNPQVVLKAAKEGTVQI